MSLKIAQHQRGLAFAGSEFVGYLRPGAHSMIAWALRHRTRITVDVINTVETRFEHPLLDVLIKDPQVASDLMVLNVQGSERAVIFENGRALTIVGPGRHAFWKTIKTIEAEVFSTEEMPVRSKQLNEILARPEASRFLQGIVTSPDEEVLIYRSGKPVDRVQNGGRFVFWKTSENVTWKSVEIRERTLEVASQDILTKDKVSLRLSLVLGWRVIDVDKSLQAVADPEKVLYRDAQLALRKAVSNRTIDKVLEDKESMDTEIRQYVERRATSFGAEVLSVGVRDIILPGDMKEILNRVIEAEREAQANLIKRREETAAARSQANTAKLYAANPFLAKMKELELVGEMLAKTRTTLVLSSKNLPEGLRGLVDSGES